MVAVMGSSTHIDWPALSHAYGPAADIPALLTMAETDTRGGHIAGSTWFDLWSALCHQGDTYSASYAAVPLLIRLAELPAYREKYDPLLLAASIEVSRLEPEQGHTTAGTHDVCSWRPNARVERPAASASSARTAARVVMAGRAPARTAPRPAQTRS